MINRFRFLIGTIAVMEVMLIGPRLISAQDHEPAAQEILATVNGTAITRMQMEEESKLIEAEKPLNQPAPVGQEMEGWGEDLLQNLIDRELIVQQARIMQTRISTRSIDEALQAVKNRFGNISAYGRYLNAIGMDEAQLRQRLLTGLLIRNFLRGEVLRNVRVNDNDLQSYYSRHSEDFIRPTQVRARHILVGVADESGRGEALLEIEALESKLARGVDFAVLSLEHSDCPSKSKGGDLGYFNYDDVVPAFGDVAFALSPGQISQPVTTRFGYHLIQVIDRSPPMRLPFIDVRAKIENTLRCNRENQAVKKYLAQLRTQADIMRYPATP